jgi:hypothetical protein
MNRQERAIEMMLGHERALQRMQLSDGADRKIRAVLSARHAPHRGRTLRTLTLATGLFFGGIMPWRSAQCQQRSEHGGTRPQSTATSTDAAARQPASAR